MKKFLVTLAIAAVIVAFAGPAVHAEITKVTGDVKIIEAPADIKTGSLESDSEIRVFVEKAEFELIQPLKLDISKPGTSPKLYHPTGRKGKPKKALKVNPNLSQQTLAPGKLVNSYYIHFDSIGQNNKSVSGSITFGEKILGLIVESEGLIATNHVLGAAATQYSVGKIQDIEWTKDTEITLSPGRRMISFKLSASTAADNIRVITDASESGKAVEKNAPISDSSDEPDPPAERGKKNKSKSAPPSGDLLRAPSIWSGTRSITNRGDLHNCQLRVESRNGDLYTVMYAEHHATVRLTLQFKLKGRELTLTDWKNNSIADFTIQNVRAWGSTDGKGMAIEYSWVISGRGRQNAIDQGSIDVTRDR